MIYTIPLNKKIYYNINKYKSLNENNIFDDIIYDANDNIFNSEMKRNYYESEYIPRLEKLFYQLDINNYEISYINGNKITVDVHEHLYLPNKKLNTIPFTSFYFRYVDGNVNFSNNKLTDWSKFPQHIGGNCYANFNYLKDFNNAPIVDGKMFADKQKIKSTYELNNENYQKYKNGELNENSVYIKKDNIFGTLYSINEKYNKCIIIDNNNNKLVYPLNEVEYIGNINNLLLNI